MSVIVQRTRVLSELARALEAYPVVALVGPRQSGKTTLAKNFISEQKTTAHFFDLEDPVDLARIENPHLALVGLSGIVVLDEIQRRPNLFPLLRVLADRDPLPARFLVLGSASGDLLRQGSETLAGRIRFIELSGLTLDEVGGSEWEKLWLRGGFPRAFLASDDAQSFDWREQFVRTFLERDIPSFGLRLPPPQVRRFWQMAAHYHGQIWNSSELSRSLGVATNTIRHYIDVLSQTFMVHLLPPWFENTGKRLVRAHKFFILDSGLLHTLLSLRDKEAVLRHPKLGASWEGFALVQFLHLSGLARDAYFWASHGGAELDLFLPVGGRRIGVEFKFNDAPTATKSMHVAIADLKLDKLVVVYPGEKPYRLREKIEVCPLRDLPARVPEWLEERA